MNVVANQLQQMDENIARKEAEIAELKRRRAEVAAQEAQVQTPAVVQPTQTVVPSIAPGQGIPNMTNKKDNLKSVANALSSFFRVAGIDEKSPEAQALVNPLMQLGTEDPNQIPDILKALDIAREKLLSITNSNSAPISPKKIEMDPPPQWSEENQKYQSANPALSKTAGENPFAKKDDKEEKPEDKDEKSDDKEEKKDDKKPAPFEKKDDKKEGKSDDKEEKKDDKKPAPFEKKDDKKDGKSDDKKESKDEKKDIDGAKKAIELIEKLIETEEKDGEPMEHIVGLKDSIDKLKKFLFEDSEMGMCDIKLDDAPALEMKDPNKTDLIVTGPAAPLPPDATNPDGGPMLGLEKNLHPITDAKPVGPSKPKLPVLDKAPKMDLAKEMGTTAAIKSDEAKEFISKEIAHLIKDKGYTHERAVGAAHAIARQKGFDVPEPKKAAAFEVYDRVWAKTAGESYEMDDEPGRIVAIAENGKIIVDWGTDIPTEESQENLVKAQAVDNEGTMFDNPTIEEEVSEGLSAFAPTSMEVTKALSAISFADAMAQHLDAVGVEEVSYWDK